MMLMILQEQRGPLSFGLSFFLLVTKLLSKLVI